MATTTNYGWTTPDDTALVKDGASAIRSLGTAIDSSFKPVYFASRINTNQSIPNATWTKVAFDTEVLDSGTVFDPTTNYRFTVPTGGNGNYLLGADIHWGVYTAGHQIQIAFYKNGTAISGQRIAFRTGSSDVDGTTYERLVSLVATDYIECYVFQSRGSAATLYNPNCNFWGHKI